MAASKRPENVSVIGRRIERELRLAGDRDTLARWMGQRVAELLATSQRAKDPQVKTEIEQELEALVMKLWERRAALPGNVDPNKRLVGALKILEMLDERQHYFSPPNRNSTDRHGKLIEAYHAVHQASVKTTLLKLIEAADSSDLNELPMTDAERDFGAKMRELLKQHTRPHVAFRIEDQDDTELSDLDLLEEQIDGLIDEALRAIQDCKKMARN